MQDKSSAQEPLSACFCIRAWGKIKFGSCINQAIIHDVLFWSAIVCGKLMRNKLKKLQASVLSNATAETSQIL